MRTEESIWRRAWLPITLSLLATVAGIFLTATNATPDGEPRVFEFILGGVLTTFGPVVVSGILSREAGRKKSLDEVLTHLNAINVNLGHSAGSLSVALKQGAAKTASVETTYGLAVQALNGIKIQINQIQKLMGRKFDGSDIQGTLDELDDMSERLSRASERNDREGVEKASSQIQKIVRSLKKQSNEKTPVDATCPNCSRETSAPLGEKQGDTAFVNCGECGYQFNVHRETSGGHFSKRLGFSTAKNLAIDGAALHEERPVIQAERIEAQKSPQEGEQNRVPVRKVHVALSCPECASELKYKRAEGESGNKLVVCLNCNRGITVSQTHDVLDSIPFDRVDVQIESKLSLGYATRCPDCGRVRNCYIRASGSYFGYCGPDSKVLRLSQNTVELFEAEGSGGPA